MVITMFLLNVPGSIHLSNQLPRVLYVVIRNSLPVPLPISAVTGRWKRAVTHKSGPITGVMIGRLQKTRGVGRRQPLFHSAGSARLAQMTEPGEEVLALALVKVALLDGMEDEVAFGMARL